MDVQRGAPTNGTEAPAIKHQHGSTPTLQRPDQQEGPEPIREEAGALATSPPLTLIRWMDARGVGSDWESLEDIELQVTECQSVGWVLAERDDCVLVVPHIVLSPNHDPEQGCGDMAIPKSAILSRHELVAS